MLKSLTGNIEWQIIGIHNTLDKVEVTGEQVFKIVLDQHFADIQTNTSLSARIIIVKACGFLGDKEDTLELYFTLSTEMDPSESITRLLDNSLEEVLVFLIGDLKVNKIEK